MNRSKRYTEEILNDTRWTTREGDVLEPYNNGGGAYSKYFELIVQKPRSIMVRL